MNPIDPDNEIRYAVERQEMFFAWLKENVRRKVAESWDRATSLKLVSFCLFDVGADCYLSFESAHDYVCKLPDALQDDMIAELGDQIELSRIFSKPKQQG